MAIVSCRNRGELVPWSIWREFESPFDSVFGNLAADRSDRRWAPAVDVKETEDAYTVEADLPGLSKEEIDLQIEDNVVTLRGERNAESKEEKDGYHVYERRSGKFERSFKIPNGFDAAEVKAAYENGVLRVTLPKREETKPKQIEVKIK